MIPINLAVTSQIEHYERHHNCYYGFRYNMIYKIFDQQNKFLLLVIKNVIDNNSTKIELLLIDSDHRKLTSIAIRQV